MKLEYMNKARAWYPDDQTFVYEYLFKKSTNQKTLGLWCGSKDKKLKKHLRFGQLHIAKKISNKYLILMKLEYMNKANLQFY
jgi:hypothetical protein